MLPSLSRSLTLTPQANMVSASISVQNRARFLKILSDFEKQKGRDVADSIMTLAKTCASKLAEKTPPYGKQDQGINRQEGSIAAQVHRAIRAGNIEGIQGSAAQVHEHYRENGVVKTRDIVWRAAQYKRSPVSIEDRNALATKKAKAAGRGKAGWIAAGEDIKGKTLLTKAGAAKQIGGVGKKVRRHVKSKFGSAQVIIRRRSAETTVVLWNKVSYIGNYQTPMDRAKAISAAYRLEFGRMKRKIES
jgi:hypothetical protein